jgi:thiosulfate reductase cytochrome b subunit
MTHDRARAGLLSLQWVLGLVIFIQSAIFAFSPESAHAFARTGLPDFIRVALAWAEMGATVVFLIPRATIIGGWLLMVVLAGAVVLHLLHGWLDVGGLLVYVAATWAVMSGKLQTTRG